VYVFTTTGARGQNFARLSVRVISDLVETSLDEIQKQILESTKKGDPDFVLVESVKVPAELPYYEIEWNSAIKEVKTKGKTIIALKGEQLFLLTGWVQEVYSDKYGSELEKVINSFGISP